jgi:cytochrome oxidase Cu insertion factor (SCO1/SenC/PrrC family)
MKRFLHGLLIILPVWAAVLAMTVPAESADTAQPARSKVMIGDMAPDFALQDENGQNT